MESIEWSWFVAVVSALAGPLDPTYLQLYLLKFVCPVPMCFGTMAPAAPGSDMYECAVCGHQRSDAQFLGDLEAPVDID